MKEIKIPRCPHPDKKGPFLYSQAEMDYEKAITRLQGRGERKQNDIEAVRRIKSIVYPDMQPHIVAMVEATNKIADDAIKAIEETP